uniref:Uncharacterized protein n=1 Tax=Oryza brachyantha TaxID=4533 RepID=J3N5C3_ORYBR
MSASNVLNQADSISELGNSHSCRKLTIDNSQYTTTRHHACLLKFDNFLTHYYHHDVTQNNLFVLNPSTIG